MSTQRSPTLFSHFATLQDPRLDRTKRHQLLEIIFIAVCAVISGANDFVAMEKFGKAKRAWLKQYLSLPNGIPSHDTFGRVMAAVSAEQFAQCFVSWVDHLRERTQGEVVSIDGKTARASLDSAKGKNPLHVVSAWAAANHLVLGQVAVHEKSNEITAIPKLLEMLQIHGAIVTIDAMGCQKEIAEQIRDQGGDYVFTVKGNQDHLEEDIMEFFSQSDAGSRPQTRSSVFEQEEKAHGREDCRRYEAASVPPTLRHLEEWQDLASICRVTRTYTEKGQEKSEARYFISSLKPDAKILAQAIRGHWGIENGLHWVLDMYFAEDRNRARTDNAQVNLALLRRWVLSLLRRDTTMKASIEKKRFIAGWNDEYLEQLLGLS